MIEQKSLGTLGGGELFEQYIHDMKIVQEFAAFNRQAMMDENVKGMGIHVVVQFTTIHNYIDNMILRKGAVSIFFSDYSIARFILIICFFIILHYN